MILRKFKNTFNFIQNLSRSGVSRSSRCYSKKAKDDNSSGNTNSDNKLKQKYILPLKLNKNKKEDIKWSSKLKSFNVNNQEDNVNVKISKENLEIKIPLKIHQENENPKKSINLKISTLIEKDDNKAVEDIIKKNEDKIKSNVDKNVYKNTGNDKIPWWIKKEINDNNNLIKNNDLIQKKAEQIEDKTALEKKKIELAQNKVDDPKKVGNLEVLKGDNIKADSGNKANLPAVKVVEKLPVPKAPIPVKSSNAKNENKSPKKTAIKNKSIELSSLKKPKKPTKKSCDITKKLIKEETKKNDVVLSAAKKNIIPTDCINEKGLIDYGKKVIKTAEIKKPIRKNKDGNLIDFGVKLPSRTTSLVKVDTQKIKKEVPIKVDHQKIKNKAPVKVDSQKIKKEAPVKVDTQKIKKEAPLIADGQKIKKEAPIKVQKVLPEKPIASRTNKKVVTKKERKIWSEPLPGDENKKMRDSKNKIINKIPIVDTKKVENNVPTDTNTNTAKVVPIEVKNETPKANLEDKIELKEDAILVKIEDKEESLKTKENSDFTDKYFVSRDELKLLTEEQKIDHDYDNYKAENKNTENWNTENKNILVPEKQPLENEIFVYDNVSSGGGGSSSSNPIINEPLSAPIDPVVNEIHNFIPKTEIEEPEGNKITGSQKPEELLNSKVTENRSEEERYKEMYNSYKEMYSKKAIKTETTPDTPDNYKSNKKIDK